MTRRTPLDLSAPCAVSATSSWRLRSEPPAAPTQHAPVLVIRRGDRRWGDHDVRGRHRRDADGVRTPTR